MERKLLDMMNQLSISEYNPRMEYCDKFQLSITGDIERVSPFKVLALSKIPF